MTETELLNGIAIDDAFVLRWDSSHDDLAATADSWQHTANGPLYYWRDRTFLDGLRGNVSAAHAQSSERSKTCYILGIKTDSESRSLMARFSHLDNLLAQRLGNPLSHDQTSEDATSEWLIGGVKVVHECFDGFNGFHHVRLFCYDQSGG